MKIANTEVPENKHVFISLTYIKGIGKTTSKTILNKLGIDKNKKTSNLNLEEINSISIEIENNYQVENNLEKKINADIAHWISIKSYKGNRHRLGLPVRGQRTHSNAKTRRKKRNYITL